MFGLKTQIFIYAARDFVKGVKNFASGKKDDVSESLDESSEFFTSDDATSLMKAIDNSLQPV